MYALFAQAPQVDFSALTSSPLAILNNVIGLIAFVCYILVIVKMFQHNQTGLAIACIVGLCVCGIGYLVAFIMGWMKSGEWNLKTVMLIWTVVLVINIALGIYVGSTMPTPVTNP